MGESVVWDELRALAEKLADPAVGPGGTHDTEWEMFQDSLNTLQASKSWAGILEMRELFDFLIVGETTGGMEEVRSLSEAAISATRHVGDRKREARYLFDLGHNYHRQGYHKESIEALERSAELYREEGESFKALESYYMTSLPHRALGHLRRAREILNDVLQRIPENDPWRGNPLQVLAWMERDEGNFCEAELFLRESLSLYRLLKGDESIHAVQTLADLGEVIGLQKRYADAIPFFEESLAIVARYGGQYDRQEARTKLKYAEMLTRSGDYDMALRLLDEADDKICGYGHYYDLLWRIELARAFVYYRRRLWKSMIRKLQLVMRYRNELGLPVFPFLRQATMRYRVGTGMPR